MPSMRSGMTSIARSRLNAKKLPERERARDDHAAGDEQHRALRDKRQEGQQRDVEGPLPVRREGLLEDGVGGARELVQAVLLLREGLHDVDADDALLRDRRDVRELLLYVAEDRLRDLAVAVRDEHDRGRDRERDERELPAVDEEDDRDDDDRHDVLGEEDQPVAEEEPHRLQINRRPRHELPRLAPVVEAEREAQEVPVELVPEVVLDAERLPARDEPPSDHEHGADDAEREDHDDPERERAPARDRSSSSSLMTKPVDDENEDRRDLGADREQRRDDQRRAVRTKEAEQAHERAPPRPSGLRRNLLACHLAVGYGSCSRRCRTCPRDATPRPLPRSARRSGRPRVFWPSTRTRTTTVRSTCSWREPASLVDALVAGIAAARDLIDLRRHQGVHPRVGAADVVPLVPLASE